MFWPKYGERSLYFYVIIIVPNELCRRAKKWPRYAEVSTCDMQGGIFSHDFAVFPIFTVCSFNNFEMCSSMTYKIGMKGPVQGHLSLKTLSSVCGKRERKYPPLRPPEPQPEGH